MEILGKFESRRVRLAAWYAGLVFVLIVGGWILLAMNGFPDLQTSTTFMLSWLLTVVMIVVTGRTLFKRNGRLRSTRGLGPY